jgi:hypothetical protein
MDVMPGTADDGDRIEVVLPVPQGEVTAVDVLPAFRAFTEATIAYAMCDPRAPTAGVPRTPGHVASRLLLGGVAPR